jgi:glycosyltransferase involved in cell wall biosynthesis
VALSANGPWRRVQLKDKYVARQPGAVVARNLGVAERTPNFVLVFCDDLGYGDIGAC